MGPGDEVITSPITDIGTVIGVIYQQAVPVFADLGEGTYNLDVADVDGDNKDEIAGVLEVMTRDAMPVDADVATHCPGHAGVG